MKRGMTLRISAVLGASALTAGLAGADCIRLVANHDPTQPNHFTLDFGAYGGTRTAPITTTELTLEICDDATVRFVDYYQEAEPLILPDGSSTGNLTILVSGSTPISYFPMMGEFTTNDDYAIYFDGDLSAYQILSPFVFQDQSSTGVITWQTADAGTVSMSWAGQSALPNPFDPGGPLIPFSYTCAVNANFRLSTGCGPSGGCAADLDGDCSAGLADLGQLLANFGSTGPRVRPAEGDLDGDLDVDLTDLTTFLSQFGTSCN